jgi:hypothetical protein
VLSPLVSMESEKRAIRDFHGVGESEAKGRVFSPDPFYLPKPTPSLRKGGPKDSKFNQHQKTEIPDSSIEDPEDTVFNKKKAIMPWILPKPPLSSLVKDESPLGMVRPDIHIGPTFSSLMIDGSSSHNIEPNTQELQTIKNMILSLQFDLEEERCKRECLEEKLRKFEGNLTRQSQESLECK